MNFKFIGYYQSYKYFIDYENEILNLLNINNKKNILNNRYLNKYDFENSISIHFRIGDYKNLQKYHPIISIDYYINSINEIINITNKNNWNVIYFYEINDFEIIENNISVLKKKFININFIPIDTNIPDYEQILLLSLCKHNVIANSTFSWWGAYFNNNHDKIVTYPSNWFGKKIKIDLSDLFPLKWKKIG